MRINRTNDYVFAKIFGDPKHKEIALSLINAVFEFEGTDLIDDIEFKDKTIMPEYEKGKLSRLDILGRTLKGEKIDIEMQVANEHNMERRTLYYWSKIYSTLDAGVDYNELKRTVTINFLCYNFLPIDSFHSMYALYNMQNRHLLTKDLEIHFIEIPKWKFHNLKELKRLDRWLAYFTNKVSEKEMEEIAMQEPAIQKALEIESIFTKDEILRREYEQREKAIMDYTSAMSAAENIGMERGLELGLEKGIKQGMRRGIERGIEQGIEQQGLQIAMTMLKDNMPIAIIEKYTGISLEKIQALRNQI